MNTVSTTPEEAAFIVSFYAAIFLGAEFLILGPEFCGESVIARAFFFVFG